MSRKILFFIIFTILGLGAFQISVSPIVGSSQSFTLFELMGPAGGMFLGSWLGALASFFVRAISVAARRQPLDLLTIIRFLPAIMAAVYFGSKSRKPAIVFPICILLFILNPVGRQAWAYSLVWLVPLASSFFKKRLILNSLGATFSAHAVGSVIFLYTFNLPASSWIALIPVVFVERGVFAVGIWASCLAMNTVLDFVTNFKSIHFLKPLVNKRYLLSPKFFKSFA